LSSRRFRPHWQALKKPGSGEHRMGRTARGAAVSCPCCFVTLWCCGWFSMAASLFIAQCKGMGDKAALDQVQWQRATCTVVSGGIAGGSFDFFSGAKSDDDITRGGCQGQGRSFLDGISSYWRGFQEPSQEKKFYIPWSEVTVDAQYPAQCLYRWGTSNAFADESWERATDFIHENPVGTSMPCFYDPAGGHPLAQRTEGAPSGGSWARFTWAVVLFIIGCLCCIGFCFGRGEDDDRRDHQDLSVC